jgi:ribosome-associated toxin RatA of RatAB toxin-antitoxin module
MPTAISSALVPATPDRVFDFIADYRNITRLQTQFASAKLASEIERGQGAVVELSGRFHGMPMRVKNRIVTFTPPRRLVSVSEGTVLSRNVWEFEPVEGEETPSTRVTFSVEYKVAAGPFGKLFTGVASSLFHKEIQEMTDESLRRLQALMEQDLT